MKRKTFNKQFEQMKKVANRTFEEVFRSMQLLNYTVLYYDFNFSKEDIKTFNQNITDYNNSCIDDKEAFFKEIDRLLTEYNFSCEKSAKEFPARAKMKMMQYKCKDMKEWDVALHNSTDAVEVCLVLFLRELTTTWSKDASDVALYWEKMKENSINYANGMTDDFVRQYFRDELDLDITG